MTLDLELIRRNEILSEICILINAGNADQAISKSLGLLLFNSVPFTVFKHLRVLVDDCPQFD